MYFNFIGTKPFKLTAFTIVNFDNSGKIEGYSNFRIEINCRIHYFPFDSRDLKNKLVIDC
jgi:hypothetical protein